MASPAAARRLLGLLLPALLCASSTRAGDDGMLVSQRKLAMIGDIEITGALPSYPPAVMRDEDAINPDAVKAAVAAYRRGALGEGDDSLRGSTTARRARCSNGWRSTPMRAPCPSRGSTPSSASIRIIRPQPVFDDAPKRR